MKIRPVVSEFPCGRTDRHDEVNSLFIIIIFLQFYVLWLNADTGPVAVFWIGGKKVLEVLHLLYGVFFDMLVDGLYLSTFTFHNVIGNINTDRH